MKFQKIILPIVSIVLLSGCNNIENSSSSTSISSSISSSTSITSTTSEEPAIEDNIEAVRQIVKELKGNYNHASYTITQLDYYGAVDITTTRAGEKTSYHDYFYQDLYSEQIGESTPYNGRIDRGFDNSEHLYQITQVDNMLDKIFIDRDDNGEYPADYLEYFFSVDFATIYCYEVLDSSLTALKQYSGCSAYLDTNIFDVDFNQDGVKSFNYRLTFKKGSYVQFEFYREDTLTIQNSEIIKSQSSYYQSVEDATNYQSIANEIEYSTIDSVYDGDKLIDLN